ncbi:hypothetical protein [Bacillus cereus]|uniref:hypothetical protein n=1 Tax=Bacillus cereus TaxID=1396 RepID=UPI00178C2746|nr:hypothetical protein [Bacillus cereus]
MIGDNDRTGVINERNKRNDRVEDMENKFRETLDENLKGIDVFKKYNRTRKTIKNLEHSIKETAKKE